MFDAMELEERDHESSVRATDGPTEEGPALRDAAAAAALTARDEAEADATRARLADGTPPPIAPDDRIKPHLAEREQLHGLRSSAILKSPGEDRALGYGGTLYLTSSRLVHLGQVMMTVQLADIREISVAAGRLMIELRGGEGFTIDVDRPRVFRTEIAAAMRGVRT
jgi:hypothetical protein